MADVTLKEKTSKGMFWGGASSFIKQLLNLFFGLFLARLLSPSDYGLVGMLAVFSTLGMAIPDSGFSAALINRKSIKHEDYNAVFWFNIALAAGFYVILFLCAPWIARFFHAPELIALSRLYFMGFVIASLGIAPSALLSKQLKIKEKAISMIVALIVSGVVGLYLAYEGYGYWVLAIQSLIWAAVMDICLFSFSGWHPSFTWKFKPIKEMWGFSIKLLITRVIEIVNYHFYSVVFGRLYTEKEVGYYSQANKWSDLGSSTIKDMVISVAQPVMVEIENDEERQLRAFRKMVRFVSFISFPSLFGLAFVAPEFITVALTDKWAESAQMLRILCIYGAFCPLNTLFGHLIVSKGWSSVYMWVNIGLFAALFLTMMITVSLGIIWMIIIYTAINILWSFVWLSQVHRIINYSLKSFIKDIIPYIAISMGLIAGTYFITRGINNIYLLLISKIVIVAASYFLIMWLSGSVTFRESIGFIKQKLFKNQVGK